MRDYKNLLVWEKAHKLTLAVYKTTLRFPREERYGLISQVRRASASIAANLAGVAAGDPMARWRALFRSRWDREPNRPTIFC
jgi:hypothetical protein